MVDVCSGGEGGRRGANTEAHAWKGTAYAEGDMNQQHHHKKKERSDSLISLALYYTASLHWQRLTC